MQIKYSAVSSSLSTVLSALATFISKRVVVPTLRSAGNLKHTSLKQQVVETSKAYEAALDLQVSLRDALNQAVDESRKLQATHSAARKTLTKFASDRVL